VDIKPSVETTVEIYPEMVGSVLGKAGATIKVIRQKSGAHVRVEGKARQGWVREGERRARLSRAVRRRRRWDHATCLDSRNVGHVCGGMRGAAGQE
jgi:hypothetical protein